MSGLADVGYDQGPKHGAGCLEAGNQSPMASTREGHS